MPTWKLTLEYDGTRYRGWQTQKNTDRTVQGVLLRAAQELYGEDAAAGGAGRTDAGVHALAQVAHLKARRELPTREIHEGLNDRLPFDVHQVGLRAQLGDARGHGNDQSFHLRAGRLFEPVRLRLP